MTKDSKNEKEKDPCILIRDLGESVFSSLRELNVMSYNEATHFANLIVEKIKSRNNSLDRNRKNDTRNSRSGVRRFYKTKLCQHFEAKGECRYKDRCSYAHGINELRKRSYNHSGKSNKICYEYKQGYCSKGLSCRYIHRSNDDDDEDYYTSTNSFKRSRKDGYEFFNYNKDGGCRFYHSYGPNVMPKPYDCFRRKKFIDSFRKSGGRLDKSSKKYSEREKTSDKERNVRNEKTSDKERNVRNEKTSEREKNARNEKKSEKEKPIKTEA
uniref:C3H1-type domain-containing protein n=1 Tax=Strongyloides stercoralis TaxID=6248 RepID=A0A0K0E7D0_STRER